jgi:two-component system, chemotaxis family, sensor kinase Cph1
VNWGGNPRDKPMVVGPHGPRLTPRRSFEIFAESVKNRSLPWRRVEIDAALRLRLLIMELVVSRTEQITEMNADLLRANEELDAFAYVASHDLKEPLRGISKYAHQLMANAQQEDSERLQKLESIQRLAMRMDTLLDSLLHFSRVGRAVITQVPVNLQEVIEEALEMIAIRREEKETLITIAPAFPMIQGDRMRVREIFVNLISNALKYNDKESREIEIGSADHPEHGLALYVRDNGIGIEEKHAEVVFKIFKRLHERDAYGGGSGAGLSIVQRLVSQHGGKVWIESTPGVGSVFYFTLQPPLPALS